MVDTTPTYTVNEVSNPKVDALILSNATVQATGNSSAIYVGDAKHLELLVNVGTMTGAGTSVTFHITVLGGDASTVVRTYDGVALAASSAVDYINVDGLTTGTNVKVTWTTAGTLDGTHKFASVYVQFIAK